ncbi:MAG: hypothetical protein ABSF69_23275 [Polyangiaceae bacterium]|jgi:hypothetical protein
MPLDERESEQWVESVCERIRSGASAPAVVLDRRIALAFHEAGHAVVDHENGLAVARLSIFAPAGRPEGRAHASVPGAVVEAMLDGENPDAARLIVEGAVAGIIAEARVTAAPQWGDAYADLALAKQLAEGACPTDAEASAFMGLCIEGANRTLTERWSSVAAIASFLATQGEITRDDLADLLKQGSLR